MKNGHIVAVAGVVVQNGPFAFIRRPEAQRFQCKDLLVVR
jgi:hypothetical protein